MIGTMNIGRLKKNAAYYYLKDYDERVGGEFVFFIKPLSDNDGKPFFYIKPQSDGRLEIGGEAYITTEEKLPRYIREAKENMGGMIPIYYWLGENGEVTKKTYL